MEKINHADRGHAECGGSSAAVWGKCAGSVFLLRTMPKIPPSEAMLNGTEAHEVAEVCLTDFLNWKRLGGDPETNFGLLRVNADEAMIEAAEEYRENIWENVLQQALTNKAYGIEDCFELAANSFGTADFWCVYIDDRAQRVGAIVDYKYGYKYVDVKKNGQLAFYAVALRNFVRKHNKDLDYVRTAIFQPRMYNYPKYREHVFTAKQLDVWEKRFNKQLHQIYVLQKSTFVVGDHCKICRAQSRCPKYVKQLEHVSALKLVDPEKVVLPEPVSIEDEQLAKIVLAIPAFKAFFDACEKLALHKQMVGMKLPGLKVVLTTGKRGWIKDNEAVASGLQALGIDPYNKKLKGMGDVKRLLGGGKEAEATISQWVRPGIQKPILVSAEDNRPEAENCMDLLGDATVIAEDDE